MKKDISNMFETVSGLGPIADEYDALFCDIWGVIHNGRIPFHEACDALERFRQERGPVILISNSPRPAVAIPEQFREIGVPGELWDAIVTSGDATINELARRAPGPAFKLGPERDDALYEGLELHFSDIDDAAFISCTGLFEDDHETPDDYTQLLSEARENGIPMVCANPDIKVRRGDKEIYCGGALAQKYEDMGGEVIYAGKPHKPIYRLCRTWLNNIMSYEVPNDRVLCIGDNVHTDLAGAQNEDYDCYFIQDGLHGAMTDAFTNLLKQHNIAARYLGDRLRW